MSLLQPDIPSALEETATAPRGPRVTKPLVFLAAFAVIFSWLAVYAVTNALVRAEMMKPWPIDRDPRPVWMLVTFCVMFGLFVLCGALFGWVSGRSMRRIDAMNDEDGCEAVGEG